MALIQNLIFLIGWIHLQHSVQLSHLICLLEFFIAFKLKNKRPFVGKYDSYTRMLQMIPPKMLAVLCQKQQSRVIPSRLFIPQRKSRRSIAAAVKDKVSQRRNKVVNCETKGTGLGVYRFNSEGLTESAMVYHKYSDIQVWNFTNAPRNFEYSPF